jgi:hypothetical protein
MKERRSARRREDEGARSGDLRPLDQTGGQGRPRRLRIVVESVEVNPALDDARFRRPQ